MWGLTLDGRIIVFKTLAISKNAYLPMMIKVPTEIIVELKKYKNNLFGQLNQKLKTKQYILISKKKDSKPSVLLDKKTL